MNTLMALVMVGMGSLPTPAMNDRWFVDYARALDVAKSAEMPLLITIDQPGKAQVFPNLESDGASPTDGYVLCRVDGSTKYGAELARRFKATAYPFSAILDKSGQFVVFKRHGALSPSDLQLTLAQYKRLKPGVATTTISSSAVPATPVQSWQPSAYNFQPSGEAHCVT